MPNQRYNKEGGRKRKGLSNFLRLLGVYDFRSEEQFQHFGTRLFFIFLILAELLVVLQKVSAFVTTGKAGSLVASCAVTLTLTLSMALQLFAVKTEKHKTLFFVTDAVASALFIFFAGGSYAVLVYALVLTQFYIELKNPKHSFLLFVIATLVYMLFIGVHFWLQSGKVITNIIELIQISFSAIVILTTHFFVVQVALAFYRQYFKLRRALTELDKSKGELEKAYEELEVVTVLKERQRIAKEIHDTAGHSLTTVIMQTESAKRIIDNNPEEAKAKIISANLQAKHALEKLRNSVHLLSGIVENTPLKSALLSIIRESMDGTGISIRSDIDEVSVEEEVYRFLCNALREGISNGIRHGGATAFWFALKQEAGGLTFLLSDNGKGAGEAFAMGFGLRTMQERVIALGGEMTVVTDIDEGFEFQLQLPYREDGEKTWKELKF